MRDTAKKTFNLSEPKSKLETQKHAYGMGTTNADITDIPRERLGIIVMSEPLIRKAIMKVNRDKFGGGWDIEPRDKDQPIDDNIKRIIDDFNHNTNIKNKLQQMGMSTNIYGDGFIELIFEEPEDNTITSPAPNTQLIDIRVLNAAYIYQKKRKDKRDPIEYYIYKSFKTGDANMETYMHPTRIRHVVEKKIPGNEFGISDVYTGYHILTSKMNADKYYGEFIHWAGKGLYDVEIKGVDQTTINEYIARIEKSKNTNLQAHDENVKWQVHNPVIFNPKEFNDYFYINIAALADLPQHILTGVQPGQLTGSEIGLADYYKNIMNIQTTIYSVLLEDIYNLVLKPQGYSFEGYRIKWNPIYVDEMSEATILKTRSEAGSYLIDRGAIDEDEYRMIAREGIQNLSGESILAGPKEISKSEEPIIPSKPEPPLMTKDQLIDYEMERLRGKIEAEQQEKRLSEAKKKYDEAKKQYGD